MMSELKAPEGWALVPVKPTQDMVNAAKEIDGRLSVWKWADGYAAMLKQAPKPPEDHFPDAGKMVDEAAMARLRENGAKAWAFLGDRNASDWVDEIRGNDKRQDCEPIYQWRMDDGSWADQTRSLFYARKDDGAEQSRLRILYTAPPKREPLSDKEIVRIHSALQHGPQDTPWSWDFKQGFRAAEKAHGIGGQS